MLDSFLFSCNQKLGEHLIGGHPNQWKPKTNDTQFQQRQRETLSWRVMWEKIPVVEMPHYPWHTYINRSGNIEHTQACTLWHRIGKCTQTANQFLKYLKSTFISFSCKIESHASWLLTPSLPCTFISRCLQQRLQTRLTFGYVLDVIITCSSAIPGLLCGTAFCNYCQHSPSHHISHTQTVTHDLSHILGHLHIRDK